MAIQTEIKFGKDTVVAHQIGNVDKHQLKATVLVDKEWFGVRTAGNILVDYDVIEGEDPVVTRLSGKVSPKMPSGYVTPKVYTALRRMGFKFVSPLPIDDIDERNCRDS